MAFEHRLTKLDSGVRIVTEAMPSVRSVSLGFWIGTGSRAESDSEAGLSHLLEHLLFKGTEKYASLEIDQIFDGMGAELNAGTGKETTSVYARVIDQHVPEALDVMTDMVFRPTLTDIDSERAVILEEIAMYEDDPAGEGVRRPRRGRVRRSPAGPGDHRPRRGDRGNSGGGDRPLPRLPLSCPRTSSSPRRAPSITTASSRWCPSGRGTSATPRRSGPTRLRRSAAARRRFERKDTEQYHVCLGGPGLSRHDDRRFALRVLDTIFGGTSSSRLFQEIRERRGLAYAVYSFTSAYQDAGQVGLYLGTRADNLGEAMGVVGTELARLREEPATAEELARAKENLKGRVVLALESTGARMNRLGSEVLAAAPLLSLDEVMERIEAVSIEDLARPGGRAVGAGAAVSGGNRTRRSNALKQALAAIEPALVTEGAE